MSVRRIDHCEQDMGMAMHAGVEPQKAAACHAEAKGICSDCGIGVCVNHITSHELSCPEKDKNGK